MTDKKFTLIDNSFALNGKGLRISNITKQLPQTIFKPLLNIRTKYIPKLKPTVLSIVKTGINSINIISDKVVVPLDKN